MNSACRGASTIPDQRDDARSRYCDGKRDVFRPHVSFCWGAPAPGAAAVAMAVVGVAAARAAVVAAAAVAAVVALGVSTRSTPRTVGGPTRAATRRRALNFTSATAPRWTTTCPRARSKCRWTTRLRGAGRCSGGSWTMRALAACGREPAQPHGAWAPDQGQPWQAGVLSHGGWEGGQRTSLHLGRSGLVQGSWVHCGTHLTP